MDVNPAVEGDEGDVIMKDAAGGTTGDAAPTMAVPGGGDDGVATGAAKASKKTGTKKPRKAKRKTAKKDPNAPSRPLAAYMLFRYCTSLLAFVG